MAKGKRDDMAVIKCKKGHFYDDEKFAECPHCANRNDMEEDSVTRPLNTESIEYYAAQYVHDRAEHIHVEMDEERTIGLYSRREHEKCVAGWLVCIEGVSKGADYHIYAGFNRIGREQSNDIVLGYDMQVSRNTHCSVVYEEKKNEFYAVPKAGNLTYLNDELLEQAQVLTDGDKLCMGESILEFVAYCKGERRWEGK